MPTLFRYRFSLRTVMYGIGVSLVCFLVVYYIAFQARHIITGPTIILTEKSAPLVVTPTIVLSGTTENITSLSLNGRAIYTDDAGAFQETLVLPMGYTIVTLSAKDRYGRIRSLERIYVRKET